MNRIRVPKPKKSEITQEQLWEVLKKKKACNERAQQIVVSLIDEAPTTDEFLSKLKFINQMHYDDIIEERSISKRCGYPLCNERLTEPLKQQYVILSSVNKVFDITERKKFCCTKCFKASQYIKEQILTSPLWLRDEENSEEFQLFESTNS